MTLRFFAARRVPTRAWWSTVSTTDSKKYYTYLENIRAFVILEEVA